MVYTLRLRYLLFCVYYCTCSNISNSSFSLTPCRNSPEFPFPDLAFSSWLATRGRLQSFQWLDSPGGATKRETETDRPKLKPPITVAKIIVQPRWWKIHGDFSEWGIISLGRWLVWYDHPLSHKSQVDRHAITDQSLWQGSQGYEMVLSHKLVKPWCRHDAYFSRDTVLLQSSFVVNHKADACQGPRQISKKSDIFWNHTPPNVTPQKKKKGLIMKR